MTESKKNKVETTINEKLYSIFDDLDNLSNAPETKKNFKTKCEHIIYILDDYLDTFYKAGKADVVGVYKLCKEHINRNIDIVNIINDINNILDFHKIDEMCENSGSENQSEIILRACLLRYDGVSDKRLTDSVIESINRVTKDSKEKENRKSLTKGEIRQIIKEEKEKRKSVEKTIRFKNRRSQEIDQKDIDTILYLTTSINTLKKLLE